MSVWSWLKEKFNKALAAFKKFLMDAFSAAAMVALNELKEFAIATVKELAATDLSSDEKRKQAFAKIKAQAIAEGKELKDSMINVLIEIVVQYLKNKSEI